MAQKLQCDAWESPWNKIYFILIEIGYLLLTWHFAPILKHCCNLHFHAMAQNLKCFQYWSKEMNWNISAKNLTSSSIYFLQWRLTNQFKKDFSRLIIRPFSIIEISKVFFMELYKMPLVRKKRCYTLHCQNHVQHWLLLWDSLCSSDTYNICLDGYLSRYKNIFRRDRKNLVRCKHMARNESNIKRKMFW